MNETPFWNINEATPLHATILVADDDASVRLFISKILRRSGYSVIEAACGDHAVAAISARQGAVDLAIVEIQMPGTRKTRTACMNVLDLASEMARIYPAMNLLYVSRNHNSIAMDCIARRSPESVLFKPFSIESLLQKVTRLLDRNI